MGKFLFVGDPHAQPSNLKEMDKLLAFIVENAVSNSVDAVVFSGDMFHTHAVIRMEVQSFWIKWVKILSEKVKLTYLIVGNHDMVGDKQSEGVLSALDVFKGVYRNVIVVDTHMVDKNLELGLIPYTSDQNNFLKMANECYLNGAKKIVCHETFDGARFENGFYAPHGVDQNKLPNFDEIIGGHIHAEHRIGKVFYPGTPKWDTVSDANQNKGIWIFDSESGWSKLETKNICTPIYKFTVSEGEESAVDLIKNAINIVELIGVSSWIAKESKKYKGKARIVARPMDSIVRKQSINKNISIVDYIKNCNIDQKNYEKIKDYLENLNSLQETV